MYASHVAHQQPSMAASWVFHTLELENAHCRVYSAVDSIAPRENDIVLASSVLLLPMQTSYMTRHEQMKLYTGRVCCISRRKFQPLLQLLDLILHSGAYLLGDPSQRLSLTSLGPNQSTISIRYTQD